MLEGRQVENLQYAEVMESHFCLICTCQKTRGLTTRCLGTWWWVEGWFKTKVFLKWLANFGYTVASINYRLVDVAKWPAQLHDCKAAIRWLRANAKTYGYNPGLCHCSWFKCGWHLVALLGTTGDNDELEGRCWRQR